MNNFRKAAGIASALMVLFVLFQLIINGSPISSAGAADLSDKDGIVTAAKVTLLDANKNIVDPDKATVNDTVQLDYSWVAPSDVQAGDFVKFKLPSNISISPMNGPLGDYGTYNVDRDGTVTLTFNENATNSSDVKGTFTYGAGHLENSNLGKTEIVVPFNDKVLTTVPITIIPPTDNMITKSGSTSGTNFKQTWTINVNPEGKTLKNAWIDEQCDSVLKYESAEIYVGTTNAAGQVSKTSDKLVEGKDYTIDSAGDIHFVGDMSKTLVVEYTTVVANPKQAINSQNITNNAVLHYDGNNDGNPPTGTSTIWINYKPRELLSKKLISTNDTTGDADYQWQVEYNPESLTLPANTSITDTVGSNQVLIPENDDSTHGGVKVSPAVFNNSDDMTALWNTMKENEDYTLTYNSDKTSMVVSGW